LRYKYSSNSLVLLVDRKVALSKAGGNVADKARKPALMAGMAVVAVSDLGTALANDLPTLLVARLGLGAGRCISEAGERGLLADLANQIPSLRGRALAAQQAVTAVGIAIGAPLGGWVVERYGPRAAFLCVTVAALVALGLYAFLPETVPQEQEHNPKRILGLPLPQLQNSSSRNPDWAEFIQQNKWRGLALCQSGASFGFACKLASVPILATDILPGGAIGAGVLLSAAGLSGLIGAPVGGWLTDQIGAKTTAAICGLVSALSLLIVPVTLSVETFPFEMTVPNSNMVLQGPSLAFSLAILGWSIGAAGQTPGKLSARETIMVFRRNDYLKNSLHSILCN
jgi:predicted MFS family arabinose efflux permease